MKSDLIDHLSGLLWLLLIGACSAPFRTTLEITKPELQARIDQRFPIEKRVLIAKLSLKNPKVLLTEKTDRIGLSLEAELLLPMMALPGEVGVLGRLHYDPETGMFFLRDPEIVELQIPNLPPEYEKPARQAASIALQSNLPAIPIHQLDTPKERAAKAFIKSVSVQSGKVLVEMGI